MIAIERINVQINFKPVYEVYKLQGKRWKRLNSLKDVWDHFVSEEWLTKILIHTTGWGSETYSASRFRNARNDISDILNSCRSGRRDVNFENVQIEDNPKDHTEITIYFTLSRGREKEMYCIVGWAEEIEEQSKPLFTKNTQEDRVEWGRQMAMATEALSKHPRRKFTKTAKEEQKVVFPDKALKAIQSIGNAVLDEADEDSLYKEISCQSEVINNELENLHIAPMLTTKNEVVEAGIKACIDEEFGSISHHTRELLKKIISDGTAEENYTGYNDVKSEFSNTVRKYQKIYGTDGENDND